MSEREGKRTSKERQIDYAEEKRKKKGAEIRWKPKEEEKISEELERDKEVEKRKQRARDKVKQKQTEG